MSTMRVRHGPLTVAALLIGAGCTGTVPPANPANPANPAGQRDEVAPAGASLVTLPPVAPAPVSTPGSDRPPHDELSVAVIDSDGQLGLVGSDGQVRNTWFKFDAYPSPDRSAAVLTLGPEIAGIGPERPVMWVSLPNGDPLAEQTMSSNQELTTTSLDGTFAGFTTRPTSTPNHAIAGTRETSTIEIISRDDGLVFTQELEGNFVPEAFSRRVEGGVPSLIFLLEYFPADAPAFYRVRVLSTSTGEVSLPLNLRDKQQQVDERMAGFTRSQVVAHEHGLLFTLYRGTIDGTPDGEPYAFVHTLDFADGVWCLDVDPTLELDRLDGSLAVGGDRLYVASANGRVGAFRIPSISDPALSPEMEWVVDVGPATDRAPVMTADHEAAYVVDEQRPGMLARVSPLGEPLAPTVMSGSADAFAWHDGALHAVGEGWATFTLADRPAWLGDIAHLVVG